MLEQPETDEDMLVPVEFDGHDVYIAARIIKSQDSDGDAEEYQIVAREARLERVLDGRLGSRGKSSLAGH